MVSSLAAEQPIVVLCEDLHWADDTTVTVVARVCDHIELLRAMILVTMRPSADPPPLNVASIISIPLQPLDRSAARISCSLSRKAMPCRPRPSPKSSIGRKAFRSSLRR